MARQTHTTGPMQYIIGDDLSPAGKLPKLRTRPGYQPLSLALTLAETALMSARPASCGRIAAMTLPIAAIPVAPDCDASATAAAINASISASESGVGM